MIESKDTFSGKFIAEVKDDHILCSGNSYQKQFDDEFMFEPTDPHSDSFLLRDVTIGVDFHWQREETQQFSRSLKIVRDNDNLIAINILLKRL